VRTTLDIDNEVLLAVREIALRRRASVGSVVADLLRESLQPGSFKVEYRNGVPLLPRTANAPVVTAELVNRLRDEDD